MYIRKNHILLFFSIIILLFLFIKFTQKKNIIEGLDGFDNSKNFYSIKVKKQIKCMNNEQIDFLRCRFIENFNLIKNQCDNITRIAFGSCNTQFAEQTFWNKIIEFEPDLWVWMGDNVYMDYFDKSLSKEERIDILNNDKKYFKHMIKQYKKLLNNKNYKNFLNSDINITGIWDDHDYYQNNSGKEISNFIKRKSRNLFFQFINYNKKIKEKPFTNQGIYRNYYIKSNNGFLLVNVFLLDIRTFKTKYDILGKNQWKWLKNGLLKSEAKLNIIVSGVQILAERDDLESWAGIGKSQEKLIKILNCLGKKNTILLSGDIHKSCIKSKYGYLEITASPLSNFISNYNYKNQYHNSIGDYLKKKNYGFLEIHWDSKFENIEKINAGFNQTNNNSSFNVIEIK